MAGTATAEDFPESVVVATSTAMMQLFVVVWVLGQTGVRPPPLSADAAKALAVAAELEAARSFPAARAQLRAVLAHVDAAYRDELALRVCVLWSLEGRASDARQCFAATKFQDRSAQALSLYHQGALSEELREPVLAREQLSDCLRRYPETHGADRALVLLRALRREEAGTQAEADLLLGVASELAVTAPGEQRLRAACLCEAGRLLVELGRAERALAVLAQARPVATGTVWHDDALYWSARAARASGRDDEALALYRAILAGREASWVVGSYDSEFLDDSYLEVAELLLARGRLKEAAQAFADMEAAVPTSHLRARAEAARRAITLP